MAKPFPPLITPRRPRVAAQQIHDILREPPRGGWTRRTFLQTITAAAAIPLLTESSAVAQARQSAGRIKITDVKLQRIRLEKDWGTYEDYMGGRRGGRTGGGAITEIYTEQGLIGIGPAVTPAAVQPIKEYLAGKDPFDVNRHMALLYGGGREGGVRVPGGRPTGVEIALWDLIGKAAQQPLYKLWGGTRDRIMPYSSMFRLGPPQQRAETALALQRAGWKAIKLKSHYATLKEDVAQIEAVRNACGPDFIIATDGNKAGFSVAFQGTRGVPWSFKRALDTAKELERLDVFFLEEPLPRFDFEQLAELNRLTSINLAGGEEQNPGVHEFRWLLEQGCFDIIQPEIDVQGPGGDAEGGRDCGVDGEADHSAPGRRPSEHRLRHAPGRHVAQRADAGGRQRRARRRVRAQLRRLRGSDHADEGRLFQSAPGAGARRGDPKRSVREGIKGTGVPFPFLRERVVDEREERDARRVRAQRARPEADRLETVRGEQASLEVVPAAFGAHGQQHPIAAARAHGIPRRTRRSGVGHQAHAS